MPREPARVFEDEKILSLIMEYKEQQYEEA